MVIDHVLRDVEKGYSEDGDVPCVARHMLVLVLFLQWLGRRNVMGEKRERKTLRWGGWDLQEIFPTTQVLVIREVAIVIVSSIKSGKKLV